MTHEFKEIIQAYKKAKQQHQKAVIATVVKVEGSSYRRPGVQMLLLENGTLKGAVSGGCVEKEVFRQSQSVFQNGVPKLMTFDGQYRLGCEGMLYILIEKLEISDADIEKIELEFAKRKVVNLRAHFSSTAGEDNTMGSFIEVDDRLIPFSGKRTFKDPENEFVVVLKPSFRLVIVGAEHDAVQLCKLATMTGWEVQVIASPKDPKMLKDFPGATEIVHLTPEEWVPGYIDGETAVMLMTHNFAKDLLYLKALKNENPVYIGLLGPAKRREKLLHAFIDYFPDVTDCFLDLLYGPSGLNIGAETPQEIAISVIAEIMAVVRKQNPIHLQHKKGAIHTNLNQIHPDVLRAQS